MLASPTGDNAPFNDADWIFEIKWDGYRTIAELTDSFRMYSRNGLNFATKFAPIVKALEDQPHQMILDGEILAYNEQGLPDFQTLQHFGNHPQTPLVYQVFDLLYLNGHSTEALSLLERKELLKAALVENDYVKYCDHVVGEGKPFFKEIQKLGLEGMIAKRASSEYSQGQRSADWLKIKHINTEEVIIAGYTAPRGSRSKFGALILGRYREGVLRYAGHTGTGFDETSLQELYRKMQPLVMKESPFAQVPKTNMPATWLKPKLVCHIKFTELTNDHVFRHPVFMGLRIDKPAEEVTVASNDISMKKNERGVTKKSGSKTLPATKAKDPVNEKIIRVGGQDVKLTNQQKIYWPKEGYTKGDLVNYYQKMAKFILPYLKNRPESLNRFPNGISGESFYHKDAGDSAPDWVTSVKIFSESNQKNIDYIVCNDPATLLYLANLGCIEMNPWNSTIQKPDRPDYLIMDIDPSEKNGFDQVMEAALTVKEILDQCGARCYCKTSGATGLHIFVPMGAKYDYEQVKNFAHLIALHVVARLPKSTTVERSLQKRSTAKIYVDYLQNRKGQTIASAYSLRPKAGATASTPLQWAEVKPGLHPSQFNIHTLPERVKKLGDIFKPVLGKGIDLLKCIQKLEEES